MAADLIHLFRQRAVAKTYWGAVVGRPAPSSGSVLLPLTKALRGGVERVVGVTGNGGGGLDAQTDYRTVATARGVAWLELSPRTGRTHQLRVHCASGLHSPVLGDGKYGGARAHEGAAGGLPRGAHLRLHLHARSVAFRHPVTRADVCVTAPLPRHMVDTWTALGFDII